MQRLSGFILRLLGWRVVGQKPEEDKFVLIFAPHTSNWDFVLLMLVRSVMQIKPNFIGKHTIFWPPLSWFLKAIGGAPVNRASPKDIVEQIVEQFDNNERYILGISPEGTRSKTNAWKTGFYRIAMSAGVPIQICYIDTATREVGLGPMFQPSGDIDKDFDWLREFYQDKQGIRPELFSDIKVPSEHKYKKPTP